MPNATPASDTGSARLFVGLWPDERVREALVAHQQRWHWPRGASQVRPERLHVTLHFLGDVARDQAPALQTALAGVAGVPFTLRCEQPQRWHGGLAVLNVAPCEPLQALHAALGHVLQRLQWPVERRAYKPHVTLARRAEGAVAPADAAGIDWQVHDFVLVESRRRPPLGYEVLSRHALRP